MLDQPLAEDETCTVLDDGTVLDDVIVLDNGMTVVLETVKVRMGRMMSLSGGPEPGGPPERAENLVLVGDGIDCSEEEGITERLVVLAPCFGET